MLNLAKLELSAGLLWLANYSRASNWGDKITIGLIDQHKLVVVSKRVHQVWHKLLVPLNAENFRARIGTLLAVVERVHCNEGE